MALLFYFMQIIAGFCLFLFGVALIEDQDIAVAFLGMMFSIMGLVVMLAFVMLFDRELKGKN